MTLRVPHFIVQIPAIPLAVTATRALRANYARAVEQTDGSCVMAFKIGSSP